tara:strand:+ start:1020 stop:2231 length:1212 start_codon:yes stop_codon:yes gene_type:complete
VKNLKKILIKKILSEQGPISVAPLADDPPKDTGITSGPTGGDPSDPGDYAPLRDDPPKDTDLFADPITFYSCDEALEYYDGQGDVQGACCDKCKMALAGEVPMDTLDTCIPFCELMYQNEAEFFECCPCTEVDLMTVDFQGGGEDLGASGTGAAAVGTFCSKCWSGFYGSEWQNNPDAITTGPEIHPNSEGTMPSTRCHCCDYRPKRWACAGGGGGNFGTWGPSGGPYAGLSVGDIPQWMADMGVVGPGMTQSWGVCVGGSGASDLGLTYSQMPYESQEECQSLSVCQSNYVGEDGLVWECNGNQYCEEAEEIFNSQWWNQTPVDEIIFGCTDEYACNYNPLATIYAGGCMCAIIPGNCDGPQTELSDLGWESCGSNIPQSMPSPQSAEYAKRKNKTIKRKKR